MLILTEVMVIRQVIAYGEISDFRLLTNLFSPQKIDEATGIEKTRTISKNTFGF